MVAPALFSSARTEWFTPAWLLKRVRHLSPNGRIGLDPCFGDGCLTDPVVAYGPDLGSDGLEESWNWESLVFVNPPYGRRIGRWTTKMVSEARAGVEIVALLPARTDTLWFQRDLEGAGLCFVDGRIKFLGADSAAPFPSVLAYWGPYPGDFEAVFKDIGMIR